jgi:hypothetical protein
MEDNGGGRSEHKGWSRAAPGACAISDDAEILTAQMHIADAAGDASGARLSHRLERRASGTIDFSWFVYGQGHSTVAYVNDLAIDADIVIAKLDEAVAIRRNEPAHIAARFARS